MSGIARILLDMGYNISGSDLESNNLTRSLAAIGGRIFEGHLSSNVANDTNVLVYSSSISNDNPELKEARRKKIQIVHRAEVLAELFNKKKGIAITGTHGKTTTTSLISVMLKNAGLDPTAVIGGEVDKFHSNAHLGKSDYFVVEADESDSSFLNFNPLYAVITNIEMEHLDHYHSIGDIKRSFRSFIGNLKKGGMVFYNIDDPVSKGIMKDFRPNSTSFGFSESADIYAMDIKMEGFKTVFKCIYKNRPLGIVELAIPGKHNVLNALAAILIGLKLGLKFDVIKKAMKNFSGAKRRFELRADAGGIMLIDDYAHHPTEVRAVLSACRNWKGRRVIAVFQPHRYTRTKFLADDFGRCFDHADKLILTDIYAASEKPIKNISIKSIYDKVIANGVKDVAILKKEDIPEHVIRIARRGDMIVVMGAGDIKKVADKLTMKLNNGLPGKDYAKELKRLARGRIKLKEDLSRHTSFRIGGPADIWVEPADITDLKNILAFVKTRNIPFFVVGNGSNLLVNDGGFRGAMINLGQPFFKNMKINGTKVTVGAGYSLPRLVMTLCRQGLGGTESLVGIPGTIGGAIYMNAGGYTSPVYKNMEDLVESLKVMDHDGNIKTLKKDKIKFGYRFSDLEAYIILEAVLKLESSDAGTLVSNAGRFLHMKKGKQVLDKPSAGCIFKNPPNFQFTCGQMIDMLGLKGKRIGGAEVSDKHANFIINRGGATCRNVLDMAEFIKNKVKESYDVTLNLEVKVI